MVGTAQYPVDHRLSPCSMSNGCCIGPKGHEESDHEMSKMETLQFSGVCKKKK